MQLRINSEKMAHAYIISSLSERTREEAARYLCQMFLCSGEGPRPCGVCKNCRKVESGIHPDVLFLEREKGAKGVVRREIVVDQIRRISSEVRILPNEAERKVYVIRDADTMNASAQNAALKLLEEPPAHAAFLLLVSEPEALLPTIRSRCEILRLNAEDPMEDPEAEMRATTYLEAARSGNRKKLLEWCTDNEGLDSRAFGNFLEWTIALETRRMEENISEIPWGMQIIELMKKCRRYNAVNCGVGHMLGMLAVASIP
jgi:DNA polymerase-3 subunit delta'